MTNPDYTHLLFVVDCSGSMNPIAKDMIGGINSIFTDQAKLPGKALVDYVEFESVVTTSYQDVDIKDAKATLVPRGMTAMLDGIGIGVSQLGDKLAKLDEADRPGTVMVVVVTDGMENSSREWTQPQIKELIKQQESKYNWDFTFLGANMDAVVVGEAFGFRGDKSLTWNTNNIGAAAATLNNYTTVTRSGLSATYSDEDRKANSV